MNDTGRARALPASRLARRYGPWAVVTGASSGLGRELARELARAGLGTVLVARRRAELEELARELRADCGAQTLVLDLDLAEPGAVSQVLERTAELDVGLLIANAGYGALGPFLGSSASDAREMVAVNVDAPLALSHGFGLRFAGRRRSGLVLLSSVVAFQGVPGFATYAATKAFVQSLAEALRIEWASRGVDVLAAAPGPVHTGFAARAGMEMSLAAMPAPVARAILRALGRGGTLRPGALAKLLGGSLCLLPRWARVRLLGRILAASAVTSR
jgi:short-subunit dehydrogenase